MRNQIGFGNLLGVEFDGIKKSPFSSVAVLKSCCLAREQIRIALRHFEKQLLDCS